MMSNTTGEHIEKLRRHQSVPNTRTTTKDAEVSIGRDARTSVLRASLSSAILGRLLEGDSFRPAGSKDSGDSDESMLMCRLRELLDTEQTSRISLPSNAADVRGSGRTRTFGAVGSGGIVTLSYARIRELLVSEFGESDFERHKMRVRRAMQETTGVITGKLLSTSCDGVYRNRPCGVLLPEGALDDAQPYILIVSTFEPVESDFCLSLYFDKEGELDIVDARGMRVERSSAPRQ